MLFTGARSRANIRRYLSAGYQQMEGDEGPGTVCLTKKAVADPEPSLQLQC